MSEGGHTHPREAQSILMNLGNLSPAVSGTTLPEAVVILPTFSFAH